MLIRLRNGDDVVGYEKHENGKILHCSAEQITWDRSTGIWYDILECSADSLYPTNYRHQNYIPHTDKDRCLFRKDDVNYFEYDLVEVTMDQTFDEIVKTGMLFYNNEYGMSMMNFFDDEVSIPVNHEVVLNGDIKLIGIAQHNKGEGNCNKKTLIST